MRHLTDERQVVDMHLDFLKAQKDYALAAIVDGERRDELRLNNAWDLAEVELTLQDPRLHEDDRTVLEYRHAVYSSVRERLVYTEQEWAYAQEGDAVASVFDGFETDIDDVLAGLGSHVARAILLETRRRLKDPWPHPLALSEIAYAFAASSQGQDTILDQSFVFAREIGLDWDEFDVRQTLFEARQHTLWELGAVVSFMKANVGEIRRENA